MNDDLRIAEREVADVKAAEYAGKGYKVTRDVPLDFLPGYRADVVAEKDGEYKVIEIKSRTSMRPIPALREIERVVGSRPGWSYELQIVSEPEKLSTVEAYEWLDEAGIQTRLTQAERLGAEGFVEAALLIAWAAAEAALRLLLADEGVAIDRATESAYILGLSVAHGAISRGDYQTLLLLMAHRNTVAHGFVASTVAPTAAGDLIGVVRRLIGSIEGTHGSLANGG